MNASCLARIKLAVTALVAATFAAGCGSSDPTSDPADSLSSSISLCGTMPKAPVCEKAVCISADRSWDFQPLPAGTACNGTGTCDGNSHCIPNSPPPPPPTPRVMDFVTAEIAEIQVDITSGQPITYETRNCSAGADPVLHLVKPGPTSDQRTQLAVDDNGAGGVNARISLTPSSGGIGFLIPRAQNDAYGTCDLYRNGYPWMSGVSVGGKTIEVHGMIPNDAVETVSMPRGSEYQALYLLAGSNMIQKVNGGTGTGSSARYVMNGTALTFLVHGVGPSRVVVNDERTDADADGLGDRLEAALGTCSSTSGVVGGFDCSRAKTPKDTDGDGLSDAWEILGKRDQTPHQLLPHWGSSPRHKDLFVEVDFLDDSMPPLRMSADAAHVAAARWQDTLDTNTPAVQAQHAALLANPDGLPGVSMHFDSGLVPATPDDATLYGNWGGYDVAPASTGYSWGWKQFLGAARRGVFHWVLGTRGPSGQTADFASTATIVDGVAIAHELGHTMGIQHYGGDASGTLNCKPQYASPMNYAYYDKVGFSDGLVPAPMNNQGIAEFGNLAGAPNREYFAGLYERVFQYFVDRSTWSVDFDRDGVIAPRGVTVRAYANSTPTGDCEGVRERRTALTDGGTTTHTPAIVRLGGKVLVLTATDGGLELRVGNDTFFGCAMAGGGDGSNPCGTFGSPSTIVSGAVVGVDAVKVLASTGESVVFTFVDGGSVLKSGVIRMVSGNPVVSIDPSFRAQAVLGEPAMALSNPNLVQVVFRAAGGALMQTSFLADHGWAGVTRATTQTGTPLTVTDAPGLVLGRMPGDTADAVYMQAMHNVFGSPFPGLLKMSADERWLTTTFFTGSSSARPGMAYVPNVTDPTKGKLYSVYVEANTNVLRMRTSGVVVSGGGTVKTPVFGFDSSFDNGWTTGIGVDLMFEPGNDSNLRAAVVYNFGDWKQKAVFQPLADGIVNLTYGGFNDWAQIGQGACKSVANPEGIVTNPMPCL